MIEVLIEKPGSATRAVRLRGGVYVIGRHEGCEIQLDDKEVSRRHARMLVDGDEIVVEDLGSGNGTFIEGKSVQQKMLKHGDVVEIVPYQLRVRTGVKPESMPPPRAWLEIVDGPGTGTRFELKDDAMGIGRAEDQHIRLPDQGASRSHALVFRKGEGWAIRDNGSVNGVLVNDRKIDESDLVPGEDVIVGNTRLRFELESGETVEDWRAGAQVRTSPDGSTAVTPQASPSPLRARRDHEQDWARRDRDQDGAQRPAERPAEPRPEPPKPAEPLGPQPGVRTEPTPPPAAPKAHAVTQPATPVSRPQKQDIPQVWAIGFLLVVTALIVCGAFVISLS